MRTSFKRWLVFPGILCLGCGSSEAGQAPSGDAGTSPSPDAALDAPGSPDSQPDVLEDASEAAAEAGDDATLDGSPDDANDAAMDAPTSGPWTGTMPAAVSCSPSGDACAAGSVDPQLYASYRKDYFLPESVYPEGNLQWKPELPVNGGRLHIAGIATADGAVTDVRINGESVTTLLDGASGTPEIEWYHVWPDPVVVGEPVWVAFHSRSAEWDSTASGQIEVQTASGDALNGTFDVVQTMAPLTSVTTTSDLTKLVIHVTNLANTPQSLERLLVNGRDVLAADVACVPKKTLEAGESAMWTVPLCGGAALGDAWTVVADWAGEPPAVAGGRYLRPHYPIEAWPKSADCPRPDGNTDNMNALLSAGFDSVYVYWGNGCGSDTTQNLINSIAPSMGNYNVLIGDDFLNLIDSNTAAGQITDTSAVTGLLTGDESDGELYQGDGSPAAEGKARRARWMWRNYPDITVYNGAKTNKNVGTFAGMTDIQGMDLYVAACAPWICTLGPPPLRAAYDYLRNTRNNHMPWPTWQYSQGLGSWSGQAEPHEILVQSFSVMVAGGKGLMWFQTSRALADEHPESWQAIARSNHVFGAVRDRLRIGDITGAASTTGDALVDMIRSDDALIVPIVTLASTSGPNLASCGAASIGLPVPHWQLADQTLDLAVQVPEDFAVADAFEILIDDSAPSQVVDLAYPGFFDGRELTFEGIPLGQATPVRLLVLAAAPSVRAEIANTLAH